MQHINPALPNYPTIIHALADAVAQAPDHTASICSGRSLSFAQLGRAVTGLSRRIRAQVPVDSRVMIMLSNSLEMEVAVFAAMAAQTQVTPANPFLTERELISVLTAAEPALVIYDLKQADKLLPLLRNAGINQTLPVNLQDGSTLSDWLARI